MPAAAKLLFVELKMHKHCLLLIETDCFCRPLLLAFQFILTVKADATL